MSARLELIALEGFPEVLPGDDLAALIAASLEHNGLQLQEGDVLVLAQKIVSKAEDRYFRLAEIEPSARALEIAQQADKDPRVVELILRESREVLRIRKGAIIVEHRQGYIHANAGIDRSNIQSDADDPRVLLLPEDCNSSAAQLRSRLAVLCGSAPQIIINDSAGRAWRVGTVGMALGTAGLDPLFNQIGDYDRFGNRLEVTEPAVADELAAAASLLQGQAAEGLPVVLARGARLRPSSRDAGVLLRPRDQDMFR
ncbi:MAG: coenzyme F420-0:L-glutamate ligase [Haliea sp.]|jgi:coenzyme F420-0:L-glutamate ligase / coenzyme F420-1:gamma-L-glutamate ligase|nr:coenzyme F420-0:L-glutamate ligase [Haliea sp.]MDP4790108.1 coenzyme F420-0:L-glutamate ligase [Haliea sp.]MDP5064272.1 coenzyme F420-0:L-glutamate ligase [Haliea sp.]